MAKAKPDTVESENGGYSFEELTTPFTLRLRRRLVKQSNKVATVLTKALKANSTKHFAFQGTVIDEREYVDHPTRIKAAVEISRLMGADPPRKVESKHQHEGTIIHDLSERLERAIEATEDAIRGGASNRSRNRTKAKD